MLVCPSFSHLYTAALILLSLLNGEGHRHGLKHSHSATLEQFNEGGDALSALYERSPPLLTLQLLHFELSPLPLCHNFRARTFAALSIAPQLSLQHPGRYTLLSTPQPLAHSAHDARHTQLQLCITSHQRCACHNGQHQFAPLMRSTSNAIRFRSYNAPKWGRM